MRLFIANRGEIAARIARGARAQGFETVGVYAPGDASAPHRWLVDQAIALAGPGGYGDAQALLAAAKVGQASAVHPGYGFLSQDPVFAEAVLAAGLVWVGPSPDSMRALGDKGRARAHWRALQLAETFGIRTIDGVDSIASAEEIRAHGERMGYPLLLKASNAGGGRGLVRIATPDEVPAAFAAAQTVAREGGGALLLERWLEQVRHIEVQILGDGVQALAVGTRECSLQRRLQKVVEEAPADHLPASLRDRLAAASERLFADARYTGAGTAEFLCDDTGQAWFLEVNPRLQVEHPVTEAIFGIDLCAWQLAIARGERLPAESAALGQARGHAIEVRLNAEDPSQQFMPQTGTIRALHWPTGPGVRVDAGIAEGSEVGPNFDSLLAKIIAWGPTRQVARARLVAALEETVLLGVVHNLAFVHEVLCSDAFAARSTYTHTLAGMRWQPEVVPEALVAMARAALPQQDLAPTPCRPSSPWQRHDGFGRMPCGT